MYSMDKRVGYADIGNDFCMTLESLFSACQDCTTFHSEDSGVGLRELRKRNLAWVISAWNVVIRRRPEICENLKIQTIPYEIKGLFGCRNFIMRDKEGEAVFWADSTWAMVNTDTMRPVRVPEDVALAYGHDPRYEMDYENRKIRIPEGGDPARDIVVNSGHLDTNGHVNNIKYISMALDSSGVNQCRVGALRVEYLRQALLGDVIHPRVVRKDRSVFVELGNYCNVELREREG